MRLPLWTVEASNFLGSLVGVVFLFVARGLFNRRDGAWWLALALAVTSLGFSLAKGLAYAEAGFLAVFIVFLLATRRQFYRPASMLGQPFTIGWFAAVGVILAAAFWILFFAFHNVDYAARNLWWQFEFDAQAPRALRAVLGASVLAIALGLLELLRPPKGLAASPDAATIAQAAQIIGGQDRSDALLALMGDKSFLFSASGLAFLMFGKRGRSWIALFDPVGPRGEWPELIKRFVTLADMHGGRSGVLSDPAGKPAILLRRRSDRHEARRRCARVAQKFQAPRRRERPPSVCFKAGRARRAQLRIHSARAHAVPYGCIRSHFRGLA